MNWIDGLTYEQKKACGLLPEQQLARFQKQLAILKDPKQAIQCKENNEVQGALTAAITKLKRSKKD